MRVSLTMVLNQPPYLQLLMTHNPFKMFFPLNSGLVFCQSVTLEKPSGNTLGLALCLFLVVVPHLFLHYWNLKTTIRIHTLLMSPTNICKQKLNPATSGLYKSQALYTNTNISKLQQI